MCASLMPATKPFYLFRICLALSILPVSLIQAQDLASDSGFKETRELGRSTFNASCAGCHGLDGGGGDKAPNISGNSGVQHLSDAEVSSIISNGISGTGMPAFHNLNDRQVRATVDYIRSLGGKAEEQTIPGDATRGKEIFFGKAECSSCHTTSGQGGFLGPDLTTYAATASAQSIRDAIIKSPRVAPMGYRTAKLITAKGDPLEGLVRNEDNFSVQLQTKDGGFHLLPKNGLRSFEHVNDSLMPANYRERLNDSELKDLVSYLMATPPAGSHSTPRKKEEDEE
jgi:cytochrome c oxidase cbb3-type subunit III